MNTPEHTPIPSGLWLIVVYFVIDLLVGTSHALEAWIYDVLDLPLTGWDGDALLRLVRDDVVDGYLAAIVLVVSALIVVLAWRNFRIAAIILGLIALLQCVPDMLVGIDVALRCNDLSSETAAMCPWTTTDAYIWNGRHLAYHYLVLASVLALAVTSGRRALQVHAIR